MSHILFSIAVSSMVTGVVLAVMAIMVAWPCLAIDRLRAVGEWIDGTARYYLALGALVGLLFAAAGVVVLWGEP